MGVPSSRKTRAGGSKTDGSLEAPPEEDQGRPEKRDGYKLGRVQARDVGLSAPSTWAVHDLMRAGAGCGPHARQLANSCRVQRRDTRNLAIGHAVFGLAHPLKGWASNRAARDQPAEGPRWILAPLPFLDSERPLCVPARCGGDFVENFPENIRRSTMDCSCRMMQLF